MITLQGSEPRPGDLGQRPPPVEAGGAVGVATRAVSWAVDAVAINVTAIVTGLGVDLVLSILPVSPNFASVLKPIAAAVYVAWTCLYFVILWSWTGQTLGGRLMQVRLVTAGGGRVRVGRAVVRWVGMNVAILTLCIGFAPILVGRRGLPDWLARTLVLRTPQPSVAEVKRAAIRQAASEQREYLEDIAADTAPAPPTTLAD